MKPNRDKTNPGYWDHRFKDDYLKDTSMSNEILSSIYEAANKKINYDPSIKIEDSYYHTSMNPTLEWFNKAMNEDIHATPADCVVAFALFGVHRFHALACSERNLTRFKNIIRDCISDWKGEERTKYETGCSIRPVDDPFNYFSAYWPSERYSFFAKNPFCEFRSEEEYKEKIKLSDLEEALNRYN